MIIQHLLEKIPPYPRNFLRGLSQSFFLCQIDFAPARRKGSPAPFTFHIVPLGHSPRVVPGWSELLVAVLFSTAAHRDFFLFSVAV